MKLLRLKITDPAGFRSLPCGFEHHFRTKSSMESELAQTDSFAPFVCAGRNGSGKSNLLEVLAAIFFQLEIVRVRRNYLPDVLQNNDQNFSPAAFELDYLIQLPAEFKIVNEPVPWAKVKIRKECDQPIRLTWSNLGPFTSGQKGLDTSLIDFLLPEYVLGYSSGENEILSLPFFKLRFVQFDEYWNALEKQLPYPGRPDVRLAYLDKGFSQAILLCNLLIHDDETIKLLGKDVGIEELKEFRIIIRRSIQLTPEQLEVFASDDQNQRQSIEDIIKSNPALSTEIDDIGNARYKLNLMQLLEGDEKSTLIVSSLKRCATLCYVDESTDTLVLDFWVNDYTKQAFRRNFDKKPLVLFQAFQVLLTLNMYSVSDSLKSDLYLSNSHYISETVPTLASDQRIMRFKFVRFSKRGVKQPMMLKELSDGEHQLLHSLGLCLLFRESNSLFLLDEPETHFNPDWRANFITSLRKCLPNNGDVGHEMLITTHSPFLISDSKPDKVLEFAKNKTDGTVSISNPNYNTLGASINKITMNTFGKRETVGGRAQEILDSLRLRFENGENKDSLVTEIDQQLGDSVEKLLLINAIFNSDSQGNKKG